MNFPAASLSTIQVKTLPSNYCWDDGVPVYDNLIDAEISTIGDVTVYKGYAPFVAVNVATDIIPGFIGVNNLSAIRTIEFNDYYNLSSIKTELGDDGTISDDNITSSYERVGFCHVYLMPGKYTINIISEAINAKPRREFLVSNQIYIEENQSVTEFSLERSIPSLTSINTTYNSVPITVHGVPIKLNANLFPYSALTYGQWSNSDKFKNGSLVVNISSDFKTDYFTKVVYEVIEIPPTASIELIGSTPSSLISPVTAVFTARNTKCGSFPIDKITWDMGDGSPLITQSRWALNTNTDSGFFENGEINSFDINDPRYFDLRHEFKFKPDKKDTFNVSLTAYAANTNTHSIASLTYGPILYPSFDSSTFKIMQSEITDTGKIYLGQVGDTAAIWYADK